MSNLRKNRSAAFPSSETPFFGAEKLSSCQHYMCSCISILGVRRNYIGAAKHLKWARRVQYFLALMHTSWLVNQPTVGVTFRLVLYTREVAVR